MGHEPEVSSLISSLHSQWEALLERIGDKLQKLREANQQQQFNQAISDLDFWFGEVEAQLSSGETGRDLGGVQTLLKKHQLVEADISAHEVRWEGGREEEEGGRERVRVSAYSAGSCGGCERAGNEVCKRETL